MAARAAIEFAQKALDAAPGDAAITPERRAEFQRIETERIRRLRGSATPPQRP